MPTFRLYPNSDDGPNEFSHTPAEHTHWAFLDEDVESPNTSNFIRATVPGLRDRHGFTSVPTGLTQCQSAILRVSHRMTNGGAMSGNMQFTATVIAGPGTTSVAVVIGNNSGVQTDQFAIGPFTLDKTQMEAIQVEWDSTSFDPNDWLAVNPRWDIYAVNLDITYTETEKVLSSETSAEKAVPVEVLKGVQFGPLTGTSSAAGTWTSFDTVADYSLSGTLERVEILLKGHTLRLWQPGPVRGVRLYIGALGDFTLHSLVIKYWTRRSDGLYDLSGESVNLRSLLSASGVNDLTLPEDVLGPETGDYHSIMLYGLKTGAGHLLASVPGTTKNRGYIITNTTPAVEGFNWEVQPNFGIGNNYIQVRSVCYGPEVLFIGDSHTEGSNTNEAFTHDIDETLDVAMTRLEDAIPFWYSMRSGHFHVMNTSIGGQDSTTIKNRFATDAIGHNPQCIVLQSPGRNDVFTGVPQATSLANLDNMLDQCEAAGIPCAVWMPSPWQAGTNLQNQTLDALAAAVRTAVVAHPGKNYVVESRDRIGAFRVGGDPGNLWDFAPGMNSGDNLHPSPEAYCSIGEAIAETITDEKMVMR